MTITPENWANLLETVAQSHQGVAKAKKGPQYIAFSQGRSYQALNRSQLNSSASRLSIPQIVSISETKLEELKDKFKRGDINEEAFRNLIEKISKHTEILIEKRQAKRNRWGWRVARGTAKWISGLFSLLLIGLPFYVKLKRMDTKFEAEHLELKERIQKPVKEALNRLEKLKKKGDEVQGSQVPLGEAFEKLEKIEKDKAKIQQKIRTQIQQIPQIFRDAEQTGDDQSLAQTLQKRIRTDFPPNHNDSNVVVSQFEKDITRGISFCRKDKQLKIEDKAPQPSRALTAPEKKKQGHELLKELTSTEHAADWNIVLQLVTNQTSLNALFHAIIVEINSGPFAQVWKDPENGKHYALKVGFPEDLPPIHLEIVRNRKKEISQVNVMVKGYLDIIQYNTGNKTDQPILLHAKVIEGTLSYSVKLGEDRLPIISNLHSKLDFLLTLE